MGGFMGLIDVNDEGVSFFGCFFLRVDEKAWFNKGAWRLFEHQKWENWNNRPKFR